MNIDFKEIIRNLQNKANTIYEDNDQLRELLDQVKNKVEKNKELMEIKDDLKLLIELIKDWISGDYVDLSKNTIITVIIGLIYLASPIDLIPDFLPGGFIDDVLVIIYIIKKISSELDNYKEWKYSNEDIFEEDIFQIP